MPLPFSVLIVAATLVAQPLVDSDVLEPSVRNEVVHALARTPVGGERGEKGVGRVERLPFATNGMSRTDIAIRLVSGQKADGRWLVGTNDVTAAAIEILKAL